ncbi:MAG: DNA-processing protein DprA [Anaerolineales bacterium]
MGDTKAYWIAFHRVPRIGAARFRLLIRAFGDLETAWRAPAKELAAVGLGPRTLESLLATRDRMDPDAEAEAAFKAGYQVLTWEDDAYPARLREIPTPPPVLFVAGSILSKDETAVALVGTRNPTTYGLDATDELSQGFARAGVTVVSGLARGIDSQAHQSALRAGGRTFAVLGSGLDRIYPQEHRGLANEISRSGAVLSDYPLGTGPDPRNFPPRNRLISGLAMAIVVVEAGDESGALLTAEFAAAQARPVFAVPGTIHSGKSRGTNALIAAGARPALSAHTVLADLHLAGSIVPAVETALAPTDEVERALWEELGQGPSNADELARTCRRTASEVSSALAMMEMRGDVRRVGAALFERGRSPGHAVS